MVWRSRTVRVLSAGCGMLCLKASETIPVARVVGCKSPGLSTFRGLGLPRAALETHHKKSLTKSTRRCMLCVGAGP